MVIDGIQLVDGVEVPFRTYGFASAAGGVGQRFYAKYYDARGSEPAHDHEGRREHASRRRRSRCRRSRGCRSARGARYAKEVFEPTPCKVTLDGMRLPGDEFTGVHIASMSINLGNVLRFFGKADQPGLMNAIVGTPSPWGIIRNLPRMARGDEMRGRNILDRPCREMIDRGDRRRAARADHRRRVLPQRQEARVPRRPARADPEGRRAKAAA